MSPGLHVWEETFKITKWFSPGNGTPQGGTRLGPCQRQGVAAPAA